MMLAGPFSLCQCLYPVYRSLRTAALTSYYWGVQTMEILDNPG